MITSVLAALALQVAANPYGLTVPDKAQAEPSCGGLRIFAGAWCVSAARADGAAVSDALMAEVRAKGWIMADRGASRVLFVRRKGRNAGCEGLQMMLIDQGEAAGRSIIGLNSVPGDVCNGPSRALPNPGQRPPGGGA